MKIPEQRIHLIEPGAKASEGVANIRIGIDIRFSAEALSSYLLSSWQSVVFDAMLVAAGIDFADRATPRNKLGWKRKLFLRIPVHELDRWRNPAVASSLVEAIGFLTGDDWEIEFIKRQTPECPPVQEVLAIPTEVKAVIPYSDGMDSRAVAGILTQTLGNKLLRVRVGMRANKPYRECGEIVPFSGVPYAIKLGGMARESSARSRGFKFAMISGIAAYLVGSPLVIVPESGQGAIGPALITVSHAYPDFRNHPQFTMRMEKFLHALLGYDVRYQFPRIWSTKAETLKEFAELPDRDDWCETKTCWYDNRSSSVNGKHRNCGICAACFLRRMSVHAAGLEENPETYVVTNLAAHSLELGVDPGFKNLNNSFREYGIAGALSLHNLAAMAKPESKPQVKLHAAVLSHAMQLPLEECDAHLRSLLSRHAVEWQAFADHLGLESFVNDWVGGIQ